MMKLKNLITLLTTAILTSTFFTGCSNNNSGINGTINVYNCADYIDESLISKFEDETGINVIYDKYDTNEIMYQKIQTSPGVYDLVFPSDYMVEKMRKEGLLEKLNFNNIPNYKYISDDFLNLSYDPTNEYSVPYMWGTIGILYDSTVITEPVTSWDILWDEKYKDNIYMFDSLRDSLAIALIKNGYSLNSTNPDEINVAKEDLIKQKKLTSPVYLLDEIKDNMIAGEKALATVYSGDASYSISGNPNLKYAIPQEGSNRWVDSMTIPKGAPNKAGAEAFINFLCDPENAKINVEYIEYSTPNYGAYELLDDDVKNNPVAYPPEYVLDKCSIFTDLDKKSLKLYEEAFMDVLTH